VRQRTVEQVGEDLFDNGVAAMLGFSLHEFKWAVGEHGVIAVGGEQLALVFGGGAWVTLAHQARDQPPVGGMRGSGCERGVGNFGDLGIGDSLPGVLVENRVGVSDRNPHAHVDPVDGGAELGRHAPR
jgi:hypothetical protein